MSQIIAVVGVPTALGGQLPDERHVGMAEAPTEPGGLSLEMALEAVRTLTMAIPVVGYGATATNFDGGDGPKTVDAAAQLAGAVLR